MAIKYRPIKVSDEFWNEMKNIKLERIRIGIDKDMLSTERISRAIVKQPEWHALRDKIIRSSRDPRIEQSRRKR